MKLVERLRQKLASLGATLDDTSSEYTLTCDAPSGYVWQANGCTAIAIHFATNQQSWLSSAIRDDGLPRLRMGLSKVTDPKEIESIKHVIGDDTWGAPAEAPEEIPWLA